MKKMLLPIIRKYYKLLLSTMIVMALGCGVMTGLSGACVSLETELYSYVEDYHYPDAVITTEISNRDNLAAVSDVTGVETVNARLCADTVMKSDKGRYLSVRVFSYNDDDLQIFHFWSSADPAGRDSVYLEYNFAEDNGISAGDTVSFKVSDAFRDYFVAGIISCPETISVQPTNDSWGENADFGFAYACADLLKAETAKESSDAEDQLDEKGDELDQAKKDAETELSSAKEKLQEAKDQLAEKESLYNTSEAEAKAKKAELEKTKKNLLKTRTELTSKLATLTSTKKTLTNTKATLTEQKDLLVQARDGLAQIDSALEELRSKKELLQSSDIADSVDRLRSLPKNASIYSLADGSGSISEFISTAQSYGITFNYTENVVSFVENLTRTMRMVQNDYVVLRTPRAKSIVSRVENGEEGVAETAEYAELMTVIQRYDNTATDETFVSAYAAALDRTATLNSMIVNNDLYTAAAEMVSFSSDESMYQTFSRISELRKLASELSGVTGENISTVGETISAYDKAVSTVDAEIEKLEVQRASIVRALKEQGLSEEDIPSALKKISAGLDKVNNGLASIRENVPKIEAGIKEIDDGVKKIDDGIATIDEQLTSAKRQLDNAKSEIDQNETEINQKWSESLTEFSSLDDELAKAYAELKDSQGYEDLFNQILLYFDDDADPNATLAAAEKALGDIVVKNSFTYEDSAVNNRIIINLDPLWTLSIFMPVIFFTVILIIVFLFMSLIIKQCRREIGILRALGFSSASIKGLFCAVNLCVSVVAVLLGFGIGYGVIRYAAGFFKDYFSLPDMHYFFDVRTMAFAAVLTVAVGLAATLISAAAVSKIQPGEAMSRPAPVTYKTPRILEALTKKASPMLKFSITSLLRNKRRFVFSVICIAGSVMMIFSSIAFIAAKNYLLHEYYEERIHYDCQIIYSEEPTEEDIDALNALGVVRSVQPLRYYEATVSFNGKEEDVVINALQDGTDLVDVYDTDHQKTAIPEDGLVLEKHTAERLGITTGDAVEVNGVPLTVATISDQCIGRIQYVCEKTADLLGEPSLGCVILNIDREDEQKLLEHITEDENYLYCFFTRLTYEGNERVFETFDLASWIVIWFAIIIGLAIVQNTARTNLLEKKKELCILRTLGFHNSEISRTWFSQSLIQFFCACAVGLPTGVLVAKATLKVISSLEREYVYSNSVKEVLFTVLLVFVYILISHILSMRTMKKWDMVETVKEKE